MTEDELNTHYGLPTECICGQGIDKTGSKVTNCCWHDCGSAGNSTKFWSAWS